MAAEVTGHRVARCCGTTLSAVKAFSRLTASTGTQFPLATMVAYGPHDAIATKLVVSVIERPCQRDPAAMRIKFRTNFSVDYRRVAGLEASFIRSILSNPSRALPRMVPKTVPTLDLISRRRAAEILALCIGCPICVTHYSDSREPIGICSHASG